MPSTRTLAVALAAVVLLAGCSAIPDGGGGANDATTRDGPGHHGFTFLSDTNGEPFEATISVRKDGETLLEETVSGDGNGSYANLSSVSEPGPYRVVVNTTLPAAGGGSMSDTLETTGALGNETVVDVSYRGVAFETFRLPRRAVTESVYVLRETGLPTSARVVVRHRGEVLHRGRVPQDHQGWAELTTLPETGVYRVALSGLNGERWTNRTVVVRNPGAKLTLEPGRPPRITLLPPGRSLPVP